MLTVDESSLKQQHCQSDIELNEDTDIFIVPNISYEELKRTAGTNSIVRRICFASFVVIGFALAGGINRLIHSNELGEYNNKEPVNFGKGAVEISSNNDKDGFKEQQDFKQTSSSSSSSLPLLLSKRDSIYQEGRRNVPIVNVEYKIVFFTVAKAGCTVWKQLFRRIMGYDDWETNQGAALHERDKNGLVYLYDFDLQEANYIMTSPEYTRAIFVRDPKERVMSAFLDKSRNNGEHFRLNCCQNPKVLDALNVATADECTEKAMTFQGFVDTLMVACPDPHWKPQDKYVDPQFWPFIDFVGHLETAEQDAKTLLQRIGAWEEYGSNGWGKNHDRSIYNSEDGRHHSTDAKDRMLQYYTADIEDKVEQFYAGDYSNKVLNLTLEKILDPF